MSWFDYLRSGFGIIPPPPDKPPPKGRPSDAEIARLLAQRPEDASPLVSMAVTPGGDIAMTPVPGHGDQIRQQSASSRQVRNEAPVIWNAEQPAPDAPEPAPENPLVGDGTTPGGVGSDFWSDDQTLTMDQRSDPAFMRQRYTVLAMGEWNQNPRLQRTWTQADYVKSVLADHGM